ncbi:MAG: bile acid:sodium symporter family protein [Planctomycetota bacterium]|jgi:BASS family bile acid:Na+ symporter
MFDSIAPLLAVLIIVATAIAIALNRKTRTYGFASWVVASVLVALISPPLFLSYLPLSYKDTLTILLQLAMFGMGATLTLEDFARILKMPWGVLIGFVLQFLIMPFLGWGLSKLLGLPVDLTLGMILLGASPGGISSNVVTYLAKGNVALSVTMTACSTMAAPIMTPLMVYLYAREDVSIDYIAMFLNILLTVVAPVVLGIIANALLTRWRVDPKRAEKVLATISMIAICGICGMIAAKSQQQVLQVGWILLVAVTLHNLLGYLLGYWGSRLVGLHQADCRTIAIEVGLQNGGLAASLATEVLKRDAAAIAPALFAPIMNVTGSILATIWSRSPGMLTSDPTDPSITEPK